MTAQPPDPAETPDLEPGGGVTPGATPPAAPQTSGVAEAQPPNRGRSTPASAITILGVCVFVVAFAAVAVLLVMKILGLTG